MRRGLHILGAEAGAEGKKAAPAGQADYTPYIDAASGIAKAITEGLRSQPAPAPPPPPPLKEESNTVWYVAGGAAGLAVVIALLVRSHG